MKHFVKQILTALTGVLSGVFLIYGLSQVSVSQAQAVTSCDLVNYQEQMVVFYAPIDDDSQIRDILPEGEPYTNIGFSGGFFEITYGDNEHGWVRFHTRIMNGGCTTFLENPPPPIPLEQFPTLCLFSTNQTLVGYSDEQFSQVHTGFGVVQPGTYAIVERNNESIQLNGSSDMSGPYVSLTGGQIGGHCDGTIQLAIAQENTRVWNLPDVTQGEVISPLPTGVEVVIISGPEQGIIQPDTSLSGDWFEVRYRDTQGWVWVDRLTFARHFTATQPSIGQGTVTDNARLWSEPNAQSGEVIATFPAGTHVNITGNPQEGFIQLDSDLTGNWYPVQIGGNIGWIYEGRINFS